MNGKLVLIASVLLLSACGQEAPPAPAVATTAAAPAAAQGDPVGDATFSVAPGSFRACEAKDGAVTATAKWDVSSKDIKEVAIYVQSPGNERKLWLNGGAVGESTTGNWVFDQSKFELVERGTETPVADLLVTATPCE